MASETPIRRGGTIYIKDILPQTIKDQLKEPSYDLDKILLHQIKVVANCKKVLVQKRTELLLEVDKECTENLNNSCGPFDGEFMSSVLKDVEKDEAEARRKVLGEQESVEMFKKAFAEDTVSEDHLKAARSYRDAMTRQLRDVVEAREIVLIAMEVLRRSPMAYVPQTNAKLEALGVAYTEAKQEHVRQCEALKKLTEWKSKPELHITEEDELFSFFSDDDPAVIETESGEQSAESKDTEEESKLASALAPFEAENVKLVQFKSTKVNAVDNEFNMLADLAEDILKHAETMNASISCIQETCGCKPATDSVGISNFIKFLRMKYSNYKFKISTKGYNFSLKVMQRTKSLISLSLLTNLLDANQDMPEEIAQAQENFSKLSNAVKRICSKYGRCSMAFQSLLNKEKELEKIMQEAPKVDYAESLRISGNFAANMKEVRRVDAVKDEIKKTADRVLQEVANTTGEGVK